nr:hypothetical protein [Proteus mirabilis]
MCNFTEIETRIYSLFNAYHESDINNILNNLTSIKYDIEQILTNGNISDIDKKHLEQLIKLIDSFIDNLKITMDKIKEYDVLVCNYEKKIKKHHLDYKKKLETKNTVGYKFK